MARAWLGRVTIGVSLDGFIARPDGDIGWLVEPPAGRDHTPIESSRPAVTWDGFLPAVDHVVMGRGTYDTVRGFDEWPYPGQAVIVLSTTLTEPDGRVRAARTLDEAVAMLDAGGARQVCVDGGQTIQAFLRAGLIDEITLSWAPVLLGAGRPLFGSLPGDVLLTLRGTHATVDVMVHATYRVEPGPGSPTPVPPTGTRRA